MNSAIVRVLEKEKNLDNVLKGETDNDVEGEYEENNDTLSVADPVVDREERWERVIDVDGVIEFEESIDTLSVADPVLEVDRQWETEFVKETDAVAEGEVE